MLESIEEQIETLYAALRINAGEYTALMSGLRRAKAEARGTCICNTSPSTDGPDEACPQHGREYGYWVEGCMEMAEENTRLRQAMHLAVTDINALCDKTTVANPHIPPSDLRMVGIRLQFALRPR